MLAFDSFMTRFPSIDEPDNNDVSRLLVSRRRILSLAGLTVAAGVTLAACGDNTNSTSTASSTPSSASPTSSAACMKLTAEQMEGPYYLDDELVRSDIREHKAGVPLTLELSAVDSVTCKPLTNAAIEIWHCDTLGVYSGYAASTTDFRSSRPTDMPTDGSGTPPAGGGASHQKPVNDLTFLRGMQMTDAKGKVTFSTILPGWYAGRAVHIHTKVHVDGTPSASGYTGGHQAHTGQLYFNEKAMVELAQLKPYKDNTVDRVLLDDDSIYPGGGVTGGLLNLTYTAGSISDGVTASIAMSVETSKTHDGSDAPAMQMGRPSASPTS